MKIEIDLPIEIVAANLSGSHWEVRYDLYDEQRST